MSSFLRGAARVCSVDHWPLRLNKTKDLGAELINFDNEDPVDVIKKETNGKGAICIDAVGFEAGGHMAGNVSDGNGGLLNSSSIKANINDNNSNKKTNHDHSKISNPEYNPVNPLQVITWMAQVAKKIFYYINTWRLRFRL